MFEFFILIIFLVIAYKIYAKRYFKSDKFLNINNTIEGYVNECNQLNEHIESLKATDFM